MFVLAAPHANQRCDMTTTKKTTCQPGEFYRKNGFSFRVDSIEKGEVYVLRIGKGKQLHPMRVTVETWNRQMADAERIEPVEEPQP